MSSTNESFVKIRDGAESNLREAVARFSDEQRSAMLYGITRLSEFGVQGICSGSFTIYHEGKLYACPLTLMAAKLGAVKIRPDGGYDGVLPHENYELIQGFYRAFDDATYLEDDDRPEFGSYDAIQLRIDRGTAALAILRPILVESS